MLADAGIADKDGNIPHPKNWDDVLDMAAKTTNGEQSGMSIRLFVGSSITSFYGALKAYRGDVFEDDGTTFVVDTPKSREILSAWRKGVQNNWISTMTFTDSNAGRVAYSAGKVAIILESGSRWPEAAPMLGSGNVGPLPMPGGMKGGSMLFGSGFAIPKQSAAPYTAAKFIKEMYLTDVIQSKMMNVYGKQPVLKSAYAFAAHPGWDQMLEAAQHCVPIPHYRELPKFTNALGDNIQRYLLAQQDLDETITAVEESLDSIDKRIY